MPFGNKTLEIKLWESEPDFGVVFGLFWGEKGVPGSGKFNFFCLILKSSIVESGNCEIINFGTKIMEN